MTFIAARCISTIYLWNWDTEQLLFSSVFFVSSTVASQRRALRRFSISLLSSVLLFVLTNVDIVIDSAQSAKIALQSLLEQLLKKNVNISNHIYDWYNYREINNKSQFCNPHSWADLLWLPELIDKQFVCLIR